MKPETISLVSLIVAVIATYILFTKVLDPFSMAIYHRPYSAGWKIFSLLMISGGTYGMLTKQQAIEKVAHK